MFDRNTVIGLLLIMAIMIGYTYWSKPSEEELARYKRQQDSLALLQQSHDSTQKILVQQEVKTDSLRANDTGVVKNLYGIFAPFASGNESFSTLENEDLKLTLSNKGGSLYSVELKKYTHYDKSPLVLFNGPENEFGYTFATADAKTINTKDLFFEARTAADKKSLSMVLKVSENQYIEQVYSFNENTNLVDYKLNLVGMNSILAPNASDIDLNWYAHLLPQEKTHAAEERVSTIYYRVADDEPTYLNEGSDQSETVKQKINWVSYKQQYFNSTLISESGFKYANLETKLDPEKRYVKVNHATLSFDYNRQNQQSVSMKFFFGPNHYKTLNKLDIGLERIIPMGWGIFRWVNKYVVVNVFAFLNQYISSFGIIILLLTLIIKTALLPLVYKSYLSSAKMRVLKPELDEIKEKHGKDMAKMQQENMKLYRKAGVNPFGGCVPALLQLPILFAMFQFFPSAFELRQQSFLWSEDLSTYDSILNLPFSIPIYGQHVSLFALLMTVSSLFYAIYNVQSTGLTGQMKWMSIIMPVVFLLTLNSFAAGLNYYYFVSNLITIGQQLVIKQFVDDKALHAQIQENKKKPVQKSKFQQKLEEMAKKRGIDPNKLNR